MKNPESSEVAASRAKTPTTTKGNPSAAQRTNDASARGDSTAIKKKGTKSVSSVATSKSGRRKRKSGLKRVKSRELYAGQVLIDCDCYHRNGLQHDCPRTLCGNEFCEEKPLPKCDLGTYFIDKWKNYYRKLDDLPPISFGGTEEQWMEQRRKHLAKWKLIDETTLSEKHASSGAAAKSKGKTSKAKKATTTAQKS